MNGMLMPVILTSWRSPLRSSLMTGDGLFGVPKSSRDATPVANKTSSKQKKPTPWSTGHHFFASCDHQYTKIAPGGVKGRWMRSGEGGVKPAGFVLVNRRKAMRTSEREAK
jgi:hypothetical protein